MAATTIPTTRRERSWTTAVRVSLTAIAVVVLLAAAFALGRSTGHTTRTAPAIQVPAAEVPAASPGAGGTTETCRLGRVC